MTRHDAVVIERSFVMKSIVFASAATLLLSAVPAFAQGVGPTTTEATPAYGQAQSFGMGYISGYAFPDDGSPSGDAPTAVYSPQPPLQSSGPLKFTRLYLYPPSEGTDSGNGDSGNGG
jgi:hypothetical protein